VIEGGMKVYVREQSADCTPIEQPCPVAVCVLPESDLRKSEIFSLSFLGDKPALK
jgi:hypothetical protein